MQTILSKIDELLFILEALKESSTTDEKAFQRLERLYIKGDISSDVFRILAEVLECNKKEETKSFINKVNKKEKERLREAAAVSCSSSRRHC